jgi:hypothetical protein
LPASGRSILVSPHNYPGTLSYKLNIRSWQKRTNPQLRWFQTFAMNVSQIYDADGEPVEMKIELEPKEAAN